MAYKQVIVIRADLKLSKGKMAAQASHASLEAYKIADKEAVSVWEAEGVKKIVLKVDGLKELLEIHQKLKQVRLKPVLIKDAGHTELEPGTVTCIGVGPAKEAEIDKVTGKLKMM